MADESICGMICSKLLSMLLAIVIAGAFVTLMYAIFGDPKMNNKLVIENPIREGEYNQYKVKPLPKFINYS